LIKPGRRSWIGSPRILWRAFLGGLALALSASAASGQVERLTIWDLVLGSTVDQMPAWIEFKDYACGSDGGPPLRPLAGWSEFALCRPDAESGLYEVYFEYDDEAEYILRALNDPRVARFVGTTDKDFPVITSALFDAGGVLRGIRLVTDPRADYANDAFFDLTALRPRDDHYLLGPYIGAQFGIDPDIQCINLPLVEGEGTVGNVSIKLDCERIDDQAGLRYILQTRYYRKPGQLARDPVTNAPTSGQFESLTRAEVFQLGYGPSEPVVPR
jgi:hypothetical protein